MAIDSNALERRMRSLELYHGLKAVPESWIVLRLDGRSFSRWTADMAKPFDPDFHGWMVAAATALLQDLQGLYAYTESDEISVLLPSGADLFDREVEKLVSVSASIASAAVSLQAQRAAVFDSRIWIGPTVQHVVEYFHWRQADGHRCGLNSWAYWTLRQAGESEAGATRRLLSTSTAAKHELLHQHGIHYDALPGWQRRGIGLFWETYQKTGLNPITQQPATATRRRIAVDENLPYGAAYTAYLLNVVGASAATAEQESAAG